jgi:DnaK suppressor protein
MSMDDRGRDLARRRADAAARVDRVKADLRTVRRARSENSDDDEHDPEGATMSQLWSQSSGLLAAAQRELAEVDAALERVAAGVYGTCLRCGKSIDPGRLDARPAAEYCIDCAQRAL